MLSFMYFFFKASGDVSRKLLKVVVISMMYFLNVYDLLTLDYKCWACVTVNRIRASFSLHHPESPASKPASVKPGATLTDNTTATQNYTFSIIVLSGLIKQHLNVTFVWQVDEEPDPISLGVCGVGQPPQGLKRKAETPLGSPPEPGQVLQQQEDDGRGSRFKIRVWTSIAFFVLMCSSFFFQQ